ncbi:PaaX family transcriptional regulator [Nakamurella alba]|uniref:PaaX family transcriptional regulator n=1 Tax=Nakamurella alba TaxID=2665158 RepID=UPI002AC320A6|nr:PaaX family transcriptional regulator C-terminal domain-containing protein [Nakamurella alba]
MTTGDTRAVEASEDLLRPFEHPATLLMSVLGEYWWERPEPLPSASLVELLRLFGVPEAAARATLSRMARRGLLDVERRGRRTFYALSARAAQVLRDGAVRIFGFGAEDLGWDGRWSLVAFSVPEENRRLRDVLRDRLRWLGFASLYDGVWVTPHDRVEAALRTLAELGVPTVSAFRAVHRTLADSAAGGPERAWDLQSLRAEYDWFIVRARSILQRARSGVMEPGDALVSRTFLTQLWSGFSTRDPQLPVELLPDDWPRKDARELFALGYEELGPRAAAEFARIVEDLAPELAGLVGFQTTAESVLGIYGGKPGAAEAVSPFAG